MTKEQSNADRNERDIIRSREEERRERNQKQADKTLLSNRKARSAAGKFLLGVECAGCGSPFLQKAPPDNREVDGKEPGHPQVPSTTNMCTAATTFIIRTVLPRRDAAMPIASVVGMQPSSRHPRVMGQGCRGGAVSPIPSLRWSRLYI
jgi:hypothetical protein